MHDAGFGGDVAQLGPGGGRAVAIPSAKIQRVGPRGNARHLEYVRAVGWLSEIEQDGPRADSPINVGGPWDRPVLQLRKGVAARLAALRISQNQPARRVPSAGEKDAKAPRVS